MKNIKKAAIAVIGAVSLMMPFGALAHAIQISCDQVELESECQLTPIPIVQCDGVDGEFPFQTTTGCDLSVDKQVSVNGGDYSEADTSADAAQANVGDTITWKITVTNNSDEGLTPAGTVYVSDVLPSAGVSYVSSSASAGDYITSGFFANNWLLPLSDGSTSNLPATLTITSTSIATGLFQNIATLSKYDTGHCDGGCTYADSDSSNDSDDAWIDPSAKPSVLADSTTLTNTGNGLGASLVAGGMLALTASALVAASRQKRSEV
jgi:uncharacterized repeat protein (TIGR01451 family)